mgnify:CR=1 FL=1
MQNVNSVLDKLDTLLLNSFAKIPKNKKIGVLFSGGVDSSLILKYALDLNLNPIAYTAGSEFSKDREFVNKLADEFNFKLNFIELEKTEIIKVLPEIIHKLSSLKIDPNIMHVSLSLPFYFMGVAAKLHGIDLFLSGQGSDELFGGYHKYEKLTGSALISKMSEDTENLFKVDVVRDRAMTGQSNIDIYFPYLDHDFIDYASHIPVDLKIKQLNTKSSWSEAIGSRNLRYDSITPPSAGFQNDAKNIINKWILRELAKKKGLPDYICDRPKNALQYSSGVQKIVAKIMKHGKK